MTYELEAVTSSDWDTIRASSPVDLNMISAFPDTRAIDHSTGSFLFEVRNDDDRGEVFRRCLFATGGKSIFVSFSHGTEVGTWSVHWKAWDGIEEHEVALLNRELTEGVSSLYASRKESIVVKVSNNPFDQISKEEVIQRFDNQVGIHFSLKKIAMFYKATKELEKAKLSVFKWRFYWLRWRGLPDYLTIDTGLRNYLSPFTDDPRRLDILSEHLAQGGKNFSEETKIILRRLLKSGCFR
jgi:hypothetical protein